MGFRSLSLLLSFFSVGLLMMESSNAQSRNEVRTPSGRTVSVESFGDPSNPPLLLVHGSPGSSKNWRDYVSDSDLLARFHILVPTRLGYGKSGRGRSEPSLQKQAQGVLSALQLNRSGKPAIIVGHSYGGAVAARAALESPQSISHAILLAPTLDPKFESENWYYNWAYRTGGHRVLPNDLRMSVEESYPLPGELKAMNPRLRALQMPILYFQGTNDWVVKPKTVNTARAIFNPEKLVAKMVPGAGHMLTTERKSLVKSTILLLSARPKACPSSFSTP